jgi:hypothetical protein
MIRASPVLPAGVVFRGVPVESAVPGVAGVLASPVGVEAWAAAAAADCAGKLLLLLERTGQSSLPPAER